MKVPSLLWVAILMILPPMLIPWIETFFPTDTYWWSALIVVLLNALVLIVKTTWGNQSKASAPAGAMSDTAQPSSSQSMVAKLLIWGA